MPTSPPWARELHMIGNAHLDPVWLWRWTEGLQEARATLTAAVTLLEENPDYAFTFDQVALLEWVEESDPQLFDRVRACIRDGRLEVVGGWWVEPDCNLPTGEAFARQGLLGQRYLADRFGMTATIGCNVDPFGHNVMLPQVLRQQGMTSYVFLRPGPHESRLPSTCFWWQSPDGSQVLAYRIPHEYCSPGGDLAYHVEKCVNQVSPNVDDAMVFYGVGNHGGGPTRQNLRSIEELQRRGTFGRLVLSTPGKYFQHVRAQGDDLPVWTGELQMHAPGCYSAVSRIKALNRRAEQALLAAERYAVVAAHRADCDYPAETLQHAWKTLLFNQFHDILPGSAIEVALDDAAQQFSEVLAIAARTTNRALQAIARDMDVLFEEGTYPLVVFNPHPWQLETSVEVETVAPGDQAHVTPTDGPGVVTQVVQSLATVATFGTEMPRRRFIFPVSVPPMGHRLYRLRSGPPPLPQQRVRAHAEVLENDVLRVEFDRRTGWIRALVDLRNGVDLCAGVTSPHTVVTDDPSDTWGHRVLSYVGAGESFEHVGTRVVEDGPYRATVRVKSALGASSLIEDFSLVAGNPALQVRVRLDWREQCRLLKLRFPTALTEAEATYEVPFGNLVRPADSVERPGQSWVDLSGVVDGTPAGVTLVNDAKYAYDVTGADIGITAARSPVYAWHDPRELEADETFSYQDQGTQSFSYLLLPHGGDWRAAQIPRRAAEFLASPHVMFEAAHAGPLPPSVANLSCDQSGVLITAVKAAEDDRRQIIVRAVETHGRGCDAVITMPLLNRTIEAHFGPHQIRTFLVSPSGDEPVVAVDLLEHATAPANPGL